MPQNNTSQSAFAPSLDESVYQPIAAQLPVLFGEEHNATIYDGRNVLKLINVNQQTCVVKSFKELGVLRRIIYTYLRASKAQRSFEHACELAKRGVGTPEPIGYIAFFAQGLIKQSYYISAHVDYDFEFRDLLTSPPSDLNAVLDACALFVTELHQKGVLHADLSLGNVLVKRQPTGYEFYLVDVNRMQFRTLTHSEKVENLTRLLVQKEIRERFCTYYAQHNQLDAVDLLAEVNKHVEAFYSFRRKKTALKKLLGLKK